MKVPKDIDESKVTLHTPLLPDQIVFEGPRLGHAPLLKLEDWDSADTEHFPHLATNQLMHQVFHKNIGVTALELRKWLKGVDPTKPTMGATLQLRTYHVGSEKAIDVLGSRWVSVVGGVDTHHRHADP